MATAHSEQRQRVIAEADQRILGIVQGIEMGKAELQKKVSEAQKAADAKREAALASVAGCQEERRRGGSAPQCGRPAVRHFRLGGRQRCCSGEPGAASAPTRRRTAFSE